MVKKLKAATRERRKVMILYLFSGLEPVLGPEVYWLKERSTLLEEEGYTIIAKVCDINSFCSLWAHWGKGIAQAFWGMLEGNAPHSSTLAWKILWMGEPGRLQSMGSRRVGHDWTTSLSLFTFMHWRRKWQPIPVFLPENPRDGGAWWAAVYGVAQSRTRLKRLRSSSSSSRLSLWLSW